MFPMALLTISAFDNNLRRYRTTILRACVDFPFTKTLRCFDGLPGS
jgi:hypothetical protein